MQITEQKLPEERLLSNDESVLEDILRTFGPAVMAVMKRRYFGVLNETDLEDVISIGLYRLWTARQRFNPQRGSLQVWFFRIVENAARDVLRRGWQKARQLEVGNDIESSDQGKRNGQSSDKLFARKGQTPASSQLEVDLQDILDNLPESQRHIVTADAMAKDDVACSQWLSEQLNLPASTVRVYRKRAIDRIRKELKKRGHVS